jgi:hypothetical protein
MCHLLQKEVRYLEHIVSPEVITTDPEKLKSMRVWPTPKNKHEIRSFLGLCMITGCLFPISPRLQNH